MRDAAGNKMFHKVEIRVIFPDKVFPDRKMVQKAPARQGFNDAGIDALLGSVADQLDTLYPFWDFKIVPLAPEGRTAKFVIAFAGYRTPPPAPQSKEADKAPETSA